MSIDTARHPKLDAACSRCKPNVIRYEIGAMNISLLMERNPPAQLNDFLAIGKVGG